MQWVACSGLACAVCLHPWRSVVCESDLASQFVLDWAEANYGAVMSLFHKIVGPNFFPSPDKITLAGNVSVFVVGLTWCRRNSQSASIQSQLPSSAAIFQQNRRVIHSRIHTETSVILVEQL